MTTEHIRVTDYEIDDDGALYVTEAFDTNANRLLNWNEIRDLNANVEFMENFSEQRVAFYDEEYNA
jgi:prophage tail gpP-like protein